MILMSTETTRFIRDGEKGGRGYGGVSNYTWCSTSTETIRLIRDGEKGRGGIFYTYRYAVTTRMTLALRLAAMTAILMFD